MTAEQQTTERQTIHLGRVPPDAVGELEQRIKAEEAGMIRSIPIPWPCIHNLLGGLRPGEITILAGTPGSGKSYFSMEIGLSCIPNDVSWWYLPLEDNAQYHVRRSLAILSNQWSVMNVSGSKIKTLQEQHDAIREVASHICENPKRPQKYMGEDYINPAVWTDVTNWVAETVNIADLIIIDPITMIDYESSDSGGFRQERQGQRDFMRKIAAIVGNSKCHLMLVSHTTKDGSQVSGGADFVRFGQSIMVMRRHDEVESTVLNQYGLEPQTVTHRRTLHIEKTRNGPGSGLNVAIDFDVEGPALCEYGVIEKAKKGK